MYWYSGSAGSASTTSSRVVGSNCSFHFAEFVLCSVSGAGLDFSTHSTDGLTMYVRTVRCRSIHR